MKTKLLTGMLGAAMVLTPLTFAQDDKKPSPSSREGGANTQRTNNRSGMSDDMRRAIEFERAKDRAAARWARIEARHPSADRSADRVMDDKDPGRPVKDSKAPGAKKDQ